MEPVDGVGRVGGAGGRIDEEQRVGVRIDGRAPRQHVLLVAGRAFEAEEVLAADLYRHHDGKVHQGDETLAPPRACKMGIERLAGVGVLRSHPLLHLRRVTDLEPAIRVGDLDAVEDVDDDVTPGRRRRGHRRR